MKPNIRTDEMDCNPLLESGQSFFNKKKNKEKEFLIKQSFFSPPSFFESTQSSNAFKRVVRNGCAPPNYVGVNVTDFTSWVYSLYVAGKLKSRLKAGLDGEKIVVGLRKARTFDNEWDLIYDGTSLSNSRVLVISTYQIRGCGLRAKPDLVFRSRVTGVIVIVEIKFSNETMPVGGWLNLRAQLWMYSKIDLFANAPCIMLVGEVWGFDEQGDVGLRQTVGFMSDDPVLCKEGEMLFSVYKSYENVLDNRASKVEASSDLPF